MDIPIGVRVCCTDGDAGKSTCVVINPITNDVTHVVIYDQPFLGMERLAPIALIAETTPEAISLRCTHEELRQQPAFIGFNFNFKGSEKAHWPLVLPTEYLGVEADLYFDKFERVPPGELAVRRGTAVKALDGLVGYVQEFMAEPQHGHITHLVLSRGHLWGKRTVTIPLSAVKAISEHEVMLNLDKQAIGELPAISVRHP